MDARSQALEVLLSVEQGRSLGTALPEHVQGLDEREQRLCQELVYGVLRWHHRLHWLTRQLLKKPFKPKDSDLGWILELGLYQLLELRIPDHAAVNASVELSCARGKDWARGVVNGVLRNFLRQQDDLLKKADSKEIARYSYPKWLLNFIKGNWPDRWRDVLDASNQRPPMFLRHNMRAQDTATAMEQLAAADLAVEPVAGLNSGLRLEQPVDVALIPGFDKGAFSVQDGAAQFAAQLLAPEGGERVLDACAAPGGKTGHLLEIADIQLTALDVDEDRLLRVEENLNRLALKADCVTADLLDFAKDWDGPLFDRILLDAPCSATGVIRRHPDIKCLRKAEDIAPLVELQSACLDAVWQLLAPGGTLLYATCSILKAENEHQVKRFLERQENAVYREIDLPAALDTGAGYQFLPGNGLNVDGFFYALLAKPAL